MWGVQSFYAGAWCAEECVTSYLAFADAVLAACDPHCRNGGTCYTRQSPSRSQTGQSLTSPAGSQSSQDSNGGHDDIEGLESSAVTENSLSKGDAEEVDRGGIFQQQQQQQLKQQEQQQLQQQQPKQLCYCGEAFYGERCEKRRGNFFYK